MVPDHETFGDEILNDFGIVPKCAAPVCLVSDPMFRDVELSIDPLDHDLHTPAT